MKFSLVICTFHRPKALFELLGSVWNQSLLPNEILIIDGSINDQTEVLFENLKQSNAVYYKVKKEDRGLTRQRNFGVSRVSKDVEVIFFLDDDTVLDEYFFETIIKTYEDNTDAIGVSGYIINENNWTKVIPDYKPASGEFLFDHWMRIEGSRFSLRRIFGLEPDLPPGYMPAFSHGYSTGFLPPSGKAYEVEMLMGGIASYRARLFKEINFSPYFEGYGLYEDADFSLRASRKGKLLVNTAAKVEHHHEPEGRPNQFNYGKMVLRNGWYVWRVKYPDPPLKAKFKWHATSLLLSFVRLANGFSGTNKKAAFQEAFGRFWGWGSLFLKKPVIQ